MPKPVRKESKWDRPKPDLDFTAARDDANYELTETVIHTISEGGRLQIGAGCYWIRGAKLN